MNFKHKTMNTKIKFIALSLAMIAMTACKQEKKSNNDTETPETVKTEKIVSTVIKAERQASLTPDDVIKSLQEGNVRFVNNDLTERDHSAQVRDAVSGQYPKAIVLSCVDSRVPVEDIFDKGIGDLFVARVAGNFVNEDILGSMEYACKVAGSKLVVVLGHEYCGAIKATVDDVKLGNITPMLAKIKPALDRVEYDGDRTVKNKEFLHMVCESNVKYTLEQIRLHSPILKEMEDKGEIKIVGAIYDIHDGKVDWMQ